MCLYKRVNCMLLNLVGENGDEHYMETQRKYHPNTNCIKGVQNKVQLEMYIDSMQILCMWLYIRVKGMDDNECKSKAIMINHHKMSQTR